MKKIISTLLDGMIFLASIVGTFMLIIMLVGALKYWTTDFQLVRTTQDSNAILFSISILVAIVVTTTKMCLSMVDQGIASLDNLLKTKNKNEQVSTG